MVALTPYGLTHALKRRGGCTSAGTWPASHASGSFQISAFLCLYVNFMAQAGTDGSAAIELMVAVAEISRIALQTAQEKSDQCEISVPKRLRVPM